MQYLPHFYKKARTKKINKPESLPRSMIFSLDQIAGDESTRII